MGEFSLTTDDRAAGGGLSSQSSRELAVVLNSEAERSLKEHMGGFWSSSHPALEHLRWLPLTELGCSVGCKCSSEKEAQ